jgi:site-specific DNA-methyltransferase (adenine-specific)
VIRFEVLEMIPESVTHNLDCLVALRGMADNAFDLCFTDPPYNVGLSYSGYEDSRHDYKEWCDLWFSECMRVSKCLVFTPGLVNFLQWTDKKPVGIICWYKPNQCSSSVLRGFSVWEPVLVFGKSKYQVPQDGILENVQFQKDADFHVCPKQLKTWQKLLSWFAKGGDKVLDPFLGSGTTRIAAHNLGLDFTGIEISAEYFAAQEKRFADHIAQPKLFSVPKTEAVQEVFNY